MTNSSERRANSMTAKAVVTQPERACKHPKLDKKLRCKTCGALVDIREKKNKYGARRTDGFDSAKEARRFKELKALGVWPIERQVSFDLDFNGVHICSYRADFVYDVPYSDGTMRIVEDAKPRSQRFKKTAAYRMFVIKKKLMKACHNIDVIEV